MFKRTIQEFVRAKPALKFQFRFNNIGGRKTKLEPPPPEQTYKMPTNTITLRQSMRFGLLVFPLSCFGLAYWQVHRKKWKELLISEMALRTKAPPAELPSDLRQLKYMEYCKVHLKGTFLHDKEMYLKNRMLYEEINEAYASNSNLNMRFGHHVITPFKLHDRRETILIDRGWVADDMLDPNKRAGGQDEGVVEINAVVRTSEPKGTFVNENPGGDFWFYRDIDRMAWQVNGAPVLLDICSDSSNPHGPIGGQTKVKLRNEHSNYIATWLALGLMTSAMWFYNIRNNTTKMSALSKFVRKNTKP